MGLQSLYHGKFDPKREVHTLKEIMTLTDYKVCLYIYTFVFTGTYIGPFCCNPVESNSIPLDSSGMDACLQESMGHQKVQSNNA